MAKNTSISLTEQDEAFLQRQVQSGRFASSSEVMRHALRSLEEEERARERLTELLREGEESGFAADGVWERVKTATRARRAASRKGA